MKRLGLRTRVTAAFAAGALALLARYDGPGLVRHDPPRRCSPSGSAPPCAPAYFDADRGPGRA